MPLVQAPNGDVYELDESVASGLVGSEGSGWKLAPVVTKARPVSKK